MTPRLRERGFLPGPLGDAFAAVDRARLLPPGVRAHAALDAPLPTRSPHAGAPAPGLSPRAVALLLLALDVRSGDRVLLASPDPFLAAVASRLAAPGRVTLAAGDEAAAGAAREALEAAGLAGGVDVVAEPPFAEGAFERILLAEESPVLPSGARSSLAELGVALARTPRQGRMEIVRILRTGEEYGELLLGDLVPVERPLGAAVTEAWPLRRILAMEEALRRAWLGRAGTPEEEEFLRAVLETWREEPEGGASSAQWAVAKALFHVGYVLLMAGDLETAEAALGASISEAPSAEAHTFLGWTWSFAGRYRDAIASCQRAIAIDPEFGNPYNDIGAYLLEEGKPEEALPWLERAMAAPRYEARVYPYANLARLRLMQGDRESARQALERALAIDPGYAPAEDLLRKLGGEDGS